TGSKSPEAQEVAGRILAHLHENKARPELLKKAVISQGLAPQPEPSNYAILWQIAIDTDTKEAKSAALLALGGNLYRELNDQVRHDFMARIIGLLPSADDSTTSLVLDALGNAGDVRLLPVLTRYLSSSKELLAERALFSMRH